MIDTHFFTLRKKITLKDLQKNIPFKVCGVFVEGPKAAPLKTEDIPLEGAGTLESAGPCHMACYHNKAYKEAFQKSKAGFCFITDKDLSLAPKGMVCLVTPYPYRAFAMALHCMYQEKHASSEHFVDPTAFVDPTVQMAPGVIIGPHAHISAGVTLGAHAVMGPGVRVGENTFVDAHVTISHAYIGRHVHIGPGTRIGQRGFGFHMDDQGPIDVPQLGRVCVEDNVRIGANVTIDRGSMGDTTVGQGTCVDNLVQIAHNVHVGPRSVLVAQVGIAGSTRLGQGCILGGQAGVVGHVTLGDGVKVAAQSGVIASVADHQTIGGSPSVPLHQWHRQTALLRKLSKTTKERSKP